MTTTKKWKLNAKAVRLLRRVEKHILAEPKRYVQGTWGRLDNTSPCGTTACIAGWIDVLNQSERKPTKSFLKRWASKMVTRPLYRCNTPDRASRALGVHPVKTINLFEASGSYWPGHFRADWYAAKTREDVAKIAVARIEHFIQTGE
jgi:hypothetical protein